MVKKKYLPLTVSKGKVPRVWAMGGLYQSVGNGQGVYWEGETCRILAGPGRSAVFWERVGERHRGQKQFGAGTRKCTLHVYCKGVREEGGGEM